MKFNKAMQWSSASLVVLALAACGGGGGGDTGSSATTTPVDRKVEGYASKGLLTNAIVKAYLLDASGVRGTAPIAEGRTDANGFYSLNLSTNTGTFVIEVTADSTTRMNDEATNSIITPASNLSLRTLTTVSNTSTPTVTAHTTALTEMLTAAAGTAPTPASISAAQSGLIAALGFDPVVTRPINSNTAAVATASVNEQLQSVALLAISNLASRSQLGCTASDQASRVACVVNALASASTITNSTLNTTTQSTLRTEMLTVSTSANNQTSYSTPGSLTGVSTFSPPVVTPPVVTPPVVTPPVVTPPVVTPPVVTDLQAAKTLFASLRNNINAFYSKNDATKPLNIQADGVQADLDTAISPLDNELDLWVKLPEKGIDLLENFKSGASTQVSVNLLETQTLYSYANGYSYPSGTTTVSRGGCSLYTDADALNIATSTTPAADIVLVACGTNATFIPNSDVAAPTTASPDRFTRLGTAKQILLTPSFSNNSYTYVARSRKRTFEYTMLNGVQNSPLRAIPGTSVTIGNYGATANSTGQGTGTISYAKNAAGDITSLTLNGDMPAQFKNVALVAGAASGTPQALGYELISDKGTWAINLGLTITPKANSTNTIERYTVDGSVSAIKDGATLSSVGIGSGSYIQAEIDANGFAVKGSNSGLNLIINASAKTSSFQGTLNAINFANDASNTSYGPTKVTLSGKLSRGTGAAADFFTGTFTVATSNFTSYNKIVAGSASNYLKGTASFEGVVKAAGRPDIVLNLSASNPVYKTENITGSYVDGTNTISLSGTKYPSTSTTASYLDITASNGVSVRIDNVGTNFPVKRNNVVVANLNRSTSVITYTDGSTETLR